MFPSILIHTEMMWHAVFQRKIFSPSCCDMGSCFVNLVAYTEKVVEKKKAKEQVSQLRHQSPSKVSFQRRISVIFWTRKRTLCGKILQSIFSPLLLGVCWDFFVWGHHSHTPNACSAETVWLVLTKSTMVFGGSYYTTVFEVFREELRVFIKGIIKVWCSCLHC